MTKLLALLTALRDLVTGISGLLPRKAKPVVEPVDGNAARVGTAAGAAAYEAGKKVGAS